MVKLVGAVGPQGEQARALVLVRIHEVTLIRCSVGQRIDHGMVVRERAIRRAGSVTNRFPGV